MRESGGEQATIQTFRDMWVRLDTRTKPVPQISKSAVSRVAKPADSPPFQCARYFDAQPIWKSAIQQVWKPAVRYGRMPAHSVVPEEQCSRVYIQGLNETNDPQICILFDRNSCRGGDHFRSPWGHPVREVCMLDGSMEVIPDEDWPKFSRTQVELLVAAGFSRTNALHFYPAAK